MLAVLAALGFWATLADIRSRTIPNAACALTAACGLVLQAARCFAPSLVDALPAARALDTALAAPAACLMWGAGIAVLATAAELIYRRLTCRVGWGLGDVKLVAAQACVVGPHVLVSLCAACLAGALWALVTGRGTFAMAPWLSAAFMAVVLACVTLS